MNDGTAPRPLVDRLLAAHGWLVYLFFYAPIVVLTIFSFNDNSRSGVDEAVLRWYGEMFRNDDIMRAIRSTPSWPRCRRSSLSSPERLPPYRWSGSARGQRAMDGLSTCRSSSPTSRWR